jgi:TRAP-type mannitol/chloroaromatic compound transport system substrate-binding protein
MPTKSNTAKIAGGLGLAAIAATAAATYYFKGPNGKKHQKEASAMVKKAKLDMLSKIKQMKNVSKQAYHDAASEIMKKYSSAKNIDPKELIELGKELKGHWDNISKTVEKGAKKISKPAINAIAKKPAPKKKK